MTIPTLTLRFLSFLGPNKEPAVIEFSKGLNIILGASSTGKSFIVEAVNYMLGGSNPLRDFIERVGYDCVRLGLAFSDGTAFTLQRSVELGDFLLTTDLIVRAEFPDNPVILASKHAADREDNLSAYLLGKLNLKGKRLRKNTKGDTDSLSFRNIVRLILADEQTIFKEGSPILSGQLIFATKEYSLLKLLLTGMDDSALVTMPEVSKIDVTYRREILEKLLNEHIKLLGDDQKEEISEQLTHLEGTIKQFNERLSETEGQLLKSREDRQKFWKQREAIEERLNEISGLINRFALLEEQYSTDVERLKAIEESGSLFVGLEIEPCPYCGALPEHQRHNGNCEFDVSTTILAAKSEVNKISTLKRELLETIETLIAESKEKESVIGSLNQEISVLDNLIVQKLTPALSSTGDELGALIKKRGELYRKLDIFNMIKKMLSDIDYLSSERSEKKPKETTITELSESVLLDISADIERLLMEWDYPNTGRVHFNPITHVRDFVINGKPRSSEGKGLRALSYSSVIVGLLNYCRERNLPHPGFIILDSPLVAYREPEGVADDLRGKDVKDRFYRYLAENYMDRQIVVIENVDPPGDILNKINLIQFTKNPHEGRYGLFPHLQ
jgi:hypothetical protein